jgi:hypothetical protein
MSQFLDQLILLRVAAASLRSIEAFLSTLGPDGCVFLLRIVLHKAAEALI